jgi:BirA family transcriptional regulator, biotin operon repressor / biotin---[acetyl-CoA-carboxylase] ligase
MPDQQHSFDLAAVNSAIEGTEFHRWLMSFPTVPSTSDLALKAAQSGTRHGVWIADEQIAGRGRGAHTWHSPAGAGLYMTALISPPIPMQSALGLSLRVAIAVQSAIASTFGFRVRDQIDIRWPNDLMLARANGPARKCGGILIDTAANPAAPPLPAMLRYAIVGIGINLNHTAFPPELDSIATSIRRELPQPAKPLRREPLAAAILIALDEEIRLMIRGWRGTNNRPDRDFTQYSSWLQGKRVRVEARDPSPDGPTPGYTGTTAGLDPNGFLLVLGDDGQIHTVLSGGLRDP